MRVPDSVGASRAIPNNSGDNVHVKSSRKRIRVMTGGVKVYHRSTMSGFTWLTLMRGCLDGR